MGSYRIHFKGFIDDKLEGEQLEKGVLGLREHHLDMPPTLEG